MGFPSEHIIPWELISDAFQGNLSIEEQAQLQQWISSSAENQELFSQLKKIWEAGLNEYIIYREADETGAWDALHSRMTGQSSEVKKPTHVITGDFTKRRIKLMRWVSVAAVLVIAMGTIIWYMANRSGNIYQTGPGEEQTVSLPDGSSIKLYSATVIELSKDYNKSARIVTLKEGEAFFEVKHDANVPFIVNMETTRVEDLGTSFFIQKKKDSIKVSVISGKVAFVNKASNEARELSAGMSLKFQAGKKIFEPAISVDSVTANKQGLLHFENTALADVILRFGEVYNKKIVLLDSAIARERFTAQLDDQPFEGAMEILSQSLNIKYYSENGVYYLKKE